MNTPVTNNKTYTEINIGDTASISRILGKEEIKAFAEATGDKNPIHLNDDYAKNTIFHGVIAHGLLTASMFSTLIGMHLPGLGSIYVSQSLKFIRPVNAGDNITATVKVIAKDDEKKRVTLETICVNQDGKLVLVGEAIVLPPT